MLKIGLVTIPTDLGCFYCTCDFLFALNHDFILNKAWYIVFSYPKVNILPYICLL